jgi:phosphoribosylformylglycinamidine (FGAM) synthase-like enzyme
MSMGGLFGARIDLNRIGREKDMTSMEILYSESASRFLAEVEPDKCAEFEALFTEHCYPIGEVGKAAANVEVYAGESLVFSQNIEAMTKAFKKTLNA